MGSYDGPIHDYFGLSYAGYLVLPRLMLQSMPAAWQRRLVSLLREAESAGVETPADYDVQRRGSNGQFEHDPWSAYRHGRPPAWPDPMPDGPHFIYVDFEPDGDARLSHEAAVEHFEALLEDGR